MAKILIIDDDVTVQIALLDLLESEGHEVAGASDGETGMRYAHQLHPDLIICDWMMPQLDGLEVCRRVKASYELDTTFFILLTAREQVTDRVKGFDAGADEFLSKPIEPEELLARVRAGLRSRRLTQELSQANQHLAALVEVQQQLLAFNGDSNCYTQLLEPLGQAAGASRVYLFENQLDAGVRLLVARTTRPEPLLRGEWCANGVPPRFSNSPEELEIRELLFPERWGSVLAKGEIITGVVADFPESERLILQPFGILSILILPLRVNGVYSGFIGFDNCASASAWEASKVSLLRAAAAAVSLHKDRSIAVEALRKNEARYRAIVEDQTELICRFAPDGTLTFVNDAYCRYFGVKREELIGGSLVPLIPDVPYTSENPVVTREHRVILPNGEVRWQQWTERAIFDSGDRLIEFQAVGHDITERKHAEAALLSSEERFRQLAENIQQVFWISNPEFTEILYVSPAYEQIWGRTPEHLYEHPRSYMDAIHPEDLDRVLAAFMQVEKLNEEYRIFRPDGSVRWLRDRGFPITDGQGRVYRIAGITEDITYRVALETELRNALAKEKELSELKTRFVSMVSHEFRTPLTTILSSADLLEYYIQQWPAEKNSKKLESLGRIQIAAVNMTQLLEDVLFIGRSEANRLPFNPVLLDLTQFCLGLVEELQIAALNKHSINFVFTHSGEEPQGDCPKACTDEKLLRQILSNLLSNAIKYSPEGGAVHFHLNCNDTEAIFQIQDTGIGIPPEDLPHLFESFHRSRNVGNIPGTGLGLTIVKRGVDLHGGQIDVISEVGVGTTFTVRLPLNPTLCEWDSTSQSLSNGTA